LKCYELQGPSGIDGLTLVDKPVTQPGEGQVLVISLMVMQQQRLQGVTVGSFEDLQVMGDAIAVNSASSSGLHAASGTMRSLRGPQFSSQP
jgi:hypothetical protein